MSDERLRNSFEKLAGELDLARRQDVKGRHLWHSMAAIAVQACRETIGLVDRGAVEVLNPLVGPLILHKETNPRTDDGAAVAVWRVWIVPFLRKLRPDTFTSKGEVADFPNVLTNEDGKAVGKDGKVLRPRVQKDSRTGRVERIWLDDDFVACGPMSESGLIEDYDDSDVVAHLRVTAREWKEACSVLAHFVPGTLLVERFAHAEDFTWIIWDYERYEFAKGRQAESVKALWGEWNRGGRGLSELTICEAIYSDSTEFRLAFVFRIKGGRGRGMHPAWGTVIKSVGKGVYALVEPTNSD